MNDEQMAKAEILQRRCHRARHRRLRRQLEIHSPSFSPAHDEKVELRAAMRRPEEAFFPPQLEDGGNLLQCEAFPRSADLRMAEEVGVVVDAKQRMKDARIAQIHLGRLDLPLAKILEPGGKLV